VDGEPAVEERLDRSVEFPFSSWIATIDFSLPVASSMIFHRPTGEASEAFGALMASASTEWEAQRRGQDKKQSRDTDNTEAGKSMIFSCVQRIRRMARAKVSCAWCGSPAPPAYSASFTGSASFAVSRSPAGKLTGSTASRPSAFAASSRAPKR